MRGGACGREGTLTDGVWHRGESVRIGGPQHQLPRAGDLGGVRGGVELDENGEFLQNVRQFLDFVLERMLAGWFSRETMTP